MLRKWWNFEWTAAKRAWQLTSKKILGVAGLLGYLSQAMAGQYTSHGTLVLVFGRWGLAALCVFCVFLYRLLLMPATMVKEEQEKHETSLKTHLEKINALHDEIQALKAELSGASPKLTIIAGLNFDKSGWNLNVNLANTGGRPAFISGIAIILGAAEPHANGQAIPTSERILQISLGQPLATIEPNGKLVNFQLLLTKKINFQVSTSDGVLWGHGYVELISRERMPFKFRPFSDHEWKIAGF